MNAVVVVGLGCAYPTIEVGGGGVRFAKLLQNDRFSRSAVGDGSPVCQIGGHPAIFLVPRALIEVNGSEADVRNLNVAQEVAAHAAVVQVICAASGDFAGALLAGRNHV